MPKRYRARAPKMAIQMAMKTSLSSTWACSTRSAFDRNLKASANSRKPRKTLTVLSQPPDFGRELSHPGKAAKMEKGRAMASENPSMLIMGAIPPWAAAATRAVPTMGPVHEKETMARARAMKKMPSSPPRSAWESTLVPQELGRVISKAPRNEMAKITSRAKKIRLNHTLVERAFSESAPNREVTTVPSRT